MANKPGHRRFGNIKRQRSGRYQASYLGPDGRRRYAPHTFERKGDADRFLALVEMQMNRHEWTDPERANVSLAVYAAQWIRERPNLRPRTVDLYTWLLRKRIAPHLGGVPLGKMTPALVREWRSWLLDEQGVSQSQAAKAYRLLRAVLMTAVEEDGILPRNPCRIKGAGDERAPERPVLTVEQVFELSERIGRRPVGSVIGLPGGGFRIRFARHGVRRTLSQVFARRQEARFALWALADAGEADSTHDRRFRAMVLIAAFASLRYGEVTALRRSDIDLEGATVQVRVAYVERPTGEMLLGPPKSDAGVRVVGIPRAILPAVQEHLDTFVKPEHDAIVFPGPKGGPMRRSGFNKLSAWIHVVRAMGLPGLHFHDLRHTGNTFAAESGAALRDLMARLGQSSTRAAIIYQHRSQGADERITKAINDLVSAARDDTDEGEDGAADEAAPAA